MNEEWDDFLKSVNPLKKNLKIKKNFKVESYEEKEKIKDTLENTTQDEKFFNESLKNYDLEKNLIKKIYKGRIKIDRKLDLHGFSLIESEDKVNSFIKSCYEKDFKLVLIITGKGQRLTVEDGWRGTGKLKENLPIWLKNPINSKRIVWFDIAPKNKGGDGAFVVYLKRRVRG
ncbi:MAG: hypothetical protein CMP34_04315 [Rickettsiales bacterium]|nr:hypothetical protein [Rickettsiales bacterium]|tara:strand:+ start:2951 stop:3469 length:519 start_codon:yes stop_codon:yes gene_type:complete